MKIIRLTTLLDFGGQEKKYLSFTQDKSLLHHQYIFAAIGKGGFASKTIKERGFEVRIFNQNPAIKNLKNIVMLYKWFKKEKPNVVHTAAAEANFHGIIAAKLAGVPFIIAEEIGLPNHGALAKIIFRIIFRFIDKIVCVSKAVEDYLIKIKEIKKSLAVVIYNPVVTPLVFEKKTKNHFTIISVGRFEKVKNMSLLIKGFSQFAGNDKFRLILVGEGSERNDLEKLISQLQLENQVTLTGFVSQPEQWVNQADLFVLPSFSEGFGIAAVEAMLQKIPCLCSEVGGIPEFIEDGKTGWLFNPTNEKSFKTKLQEIVYLPNETLEEVATNGYNFVNEKFTVNKYVANLEALYERKL